MDEPNELPIDLSTADQWRGIRPGMMRSEALRILKDAGAEIDDEDLEDDWILAMWEETNIELFFFDGEGEQPVCQLLVDDEKSHWGGRPIINEPLHQALATLGEAARGASWRPESPADGLLPDLKALGPGPFSDEILLSQGTLWLPQKNLGLVMCDGVVNSIVWRRLQDLPTQFVGPVTEAQRQLSTRPDLEEHLWKCVREQSSAQEAKPRSSAQTFLTLAFMAVLVWLGWQAFLEQQRWQTAPHIVGKLTEIVDTPYPVTKRLYLVSFTDAEGRSHGANLESGEFYIPPTTPGEDVELAYIAGDPPRVMGLARVRDAAFIRYVPWFIGATSIFLILSISLRFLGRLMMRSSGGVIETPVLPTPGGKP